MTDALILAATLPVWGIVLISVLGVVLVVFIVLIIFGRKMQKKQEEAAPAMEAAKQTISMLIIDTKKMKPSESNLPKQVIDQIPKYMRFAKLPIVRARVQGRVMDLIADNAVFEKLPKGSEVKVVVSGIYITEIKYIRGKAIAPDKPKKGFAKIADKVRKAQQNAQDELNKDKPKSGKSGKSSAKPSSDSSIKMGTKK